MRTFDDLLCSFSLDLSAPIIVGVSYGPDSMALLHRIWSKGFKNIHVAHVHHGLRLESDQEERELCLFCQKLQVPCHVERLSIDISIKNLEDRLRDERHRFFKKIYEEIGAVALFLGHQADEQVETGLKRFFEGASHVAMGGMHPSKELFGMRVCRPQLYESKAVLLNYLATHQVPFAIDASNTSEDFLRGKMRVQMVPFLKGAFGKEFEENVLRHMEQMSAFTHYLDQKIGPALESVMRGCYGMVLPKAGIAGLEEVELDHLLIRIGVTRWHTRKRILAHWTKQECAKNVKDSAIHCFVEKKGIFFLTYKTSTILRKNRYVIEDQGKVIYEFLTL
ncbi:MAG: tRNA lysidine(34) synthetase TilS [Chlamydiia bacterium]